MPVLFTVSRPSSITTPLYCSTAERAGETYGPLLVQRTYIYTPVYGLGHLLKPRIWSELGSSERACLDLHTKGWVSSPFRVKRPLAPSSRPRTKVMFNCSARPTHPRLDHPRPLPHPGRQGPCVSKCELERVVLLAQADGYK